MTYTPWSNTVVYLPLANNLTNLWTSSLTFSRNAWTITYKETWWVQSIYFNRARIFPSSTISDASNTVSVWVYCEWWNWWIYNNILWDYSYTWEAISLEWWVPMLIWVDSWTTLGKTSSWVNCLNWWHNIVLTTWSTLKLYIDWVFKCSRSTKNASSIYPILWFDYSYRWEFTWAMSEFIIEGDTWTEQEVTSYFNSTKWNYGYFVPDYLHWDTQWPCPDGYHIPTKTDWENVVNAGISLGVISKTDGSKIRKSLRLPRAWRRDYSYSNKKEDNISWRYWISTPYTNSVYSWYLSFNDTSSWVNWTMERANWAPIRPFKNTPVVPDNTRTAISASWNKWLYHNASLGLLSISSDGTTWYTIADKNLWATTVYTDWATLSEANCGKFYQWGNNYWFPWSGSFTTSTNRLDASAYWPWNYYNSSTYILRTVTPYDRSTVRNDNLRWWVTDERPEEPEHLKKAWIYWNETLGLISLSNGDGNWITIADKNLWWSTSNPTVFQFWNNYKFVYPTVPTISTSSVSITSSQVPSKYSSSTFINKSTGQYSWSYYTDLRWETTNTSVARKWPCDNWYHVPSRAELTSFNEMKLSIWTIPYTTLYPLWTEYAWLVFDWTAFAGSSVIRLSSTYNIQYKPSSNTITGLTSGWWYQIRPFANLPVEPDNTWTVLYEPTPPTPTTLNKYITKLYHLWKEYIFDERVSTTWINVSPTSINLTKLNETAQITASVIPTNADDKKIIYTSSAPSIVSVSSTGLVKALGEGNATITVKSNDGGFSKSVSVVSKFQDWTGKELCFTANTAWSTVKINKDDTSLDITLQYSTDLSSWSTYTFSWTFWATITLPNVWSKVYFRNTSTTSKPFHANWYWAKFVMTWSVNWSWDVTFLLNKNWTKELVWEACFMDLFNWCTSLKTAPTLQATTLTVNCYYSMFYNTWITWAPALPATTLAQGCYSHMFSNCTSLTSLPKLNATALKIRCYTYMFYQCTWIKLSSTSTWTYTKSYRIPTSWTWSTATDWNYFMFAWTWWTFTGDPSINTTYYTSNTVV